MASYRLSQKTKDLLLDELNQVTPLNEYLSVSGCLPVNARLVSQMGYSAVVCCFGDFQYDFPKTVEHVIVDVDDTVDTDLSQFFEPIADLIERHRKSGGKTLVFCHRGASRSVSLILAYMLIYQKMNLRDAYLWIQSKRRVACPNLGFFKQLIELEKKVMMTSSSNNIDHYHNVKETSVKIIRPFPAKNIEVADVVWRRSLEVLEAEEQDDPADAHSVTCIMLKDNVVVEKASFITSAINP